MADTIPSDSHVIGDSGHVSDHNNIADILGLYGEALAQFASGLESATNTTNVAQILAWVGNNQYANDKIAYKINNTVTPTGLSNLAAATYQANDAQTGSIYAVEAWGYGTWGAASSSGTLEFAVAWGGSTASNLTLGGTYMASSTAFRWHVTAQVMCESPGSGATWQSSIFGYCSIFGSTLLTSGASSPNATGGFCSGESTTTYSVDSTSNQALALQAAWGSAGGSITASWARRIGAI